MLLLFPSHTRLDYVVLIKPCINSTHLVKYVKYFSSMGCTILSSLKEEVCQDAGYRTQIDPTPIPLVSMRPTAATMVCKVLCVGMKLYKALGCVVDAYSYVPSTLCPRSDSRGITERPSYCQKPHRTPNVA